MEAVKTHVARIIIRPLPTPLTDSERRVAAEIKAHYGYYGHMKSASAHARLVPDQLVERFALVGDPATLARRAEALAALGIDEIAIVPYPTRHIGVEELLKSIRAHMPVLTIEKA